MSRIDKAPDGGKFRATAAASLDGDPGVWGDGDLLCVQVNGDGLLEAATATACDGVILTTESKNDPDASEFKNVIAGRVYTVFQRGEIVGTFASPVLAAGDRVWATAAGDVDTAGAAGEIQVGFMVFDARGDRLVLNVTPTHDVA